MSEMKRTLNDRAPNFRNDEGRLFLVRCFACDPQRGTQNWAMAVASGTCAFCGWSDEAAQAQLFEKEEAL